MAIKQEVEITMGKPVEIIQHASTKKKKGKALIQKKTDRDLEMELKELKKDYFDEIQYSGSVDDENGRLLTKLEFYEDYFDKSWWEITKIKFQNWMIKNFYLFGV